jgi:D-alanyl-lipoteichoic acid acyltransferase DltB (MBOAT superfamily)
MLFNTTQFFVFFVVVLTLFYALPRPWRKYLLLIASYYFYASWNINFVPLLAIITLVDYGCALWMERFTHPGRRKAFLILSLAVNLGFLGFFKYYNFLGETLAQLMGLTPNAFALSIILPIGISFHTFQSMSYVVDVYRGEQKAVRNLTDYALFIAFFPQLVAGPIVRAGEFFEDLCTWRKPDVEEKLRGVLWMVMGLTKKMAFADQFAQIADAYFSNLAAHAGPAAAWSGVFSFAMQIFFDFSGYTDMAIGMALLLGFHFPVNFERPYLAFSITDFWHRWHISLSRWLRDYLYIPLGGNRGGSWKTYRNLILTMLLGGLWHGASWNFLIWGGYHGTLLSLERLAGRTKFLAKPNALLYPLRAVFTFVLVCVGWVFFRAATLADSVFVIRQMFSGGWNVAEVMIPVWLLCFLGLALLVAVAEERWDWIERMPQGPAWAYMAMLVALLFSVELVGVTEKTVPFIYFQF